jgi:hypothetical protein
MLGSSFDAPVVSLSWIILGPLNFDEVLVKAEIMSNAVLPTGVVRIVKGEIVANPLVNLSQRESSIWGSENGHSNKLGVAVLGLSAVIVNRRERIPGW